MRRTPEPELMDDAAQARAYAEADFGASDAAFVQACLDWFGAIDGSIADLGCGPGNIALRLAAARPGCQVVGFDGSSAMLDLARARGRDLRNVTFVRVLLPDPDLPSEHFAAVTSNSLLHHLHDPAVLWDTIRQIARPGAPVCVGDLYRPPTFEAARALHDAYTAGEPEVLRGDFLASLLAAFEVPEIEHQLEEAGFGDWQVRAVDDRHVLVTGRVPG